MFTIWSRKLVLKILNLGHIAAPFWRQFYLFFIIHLVCSAYLTRKKLLKNREFIQFRKVILSMPYWTMNLLSYTETYRSLNDLIVSWTQILSIIYFLGKVQRYYVLNCSSTNVAWVTNFCSELFCSQQCFFYKQKSKENVKL